ncbi:MAG: S1/P1 nuclease [Terriglobia bacterium]
MHQPLHDEDKGDKGGNTRHVIFEGHPENCHYIMHPSISNDNPAPINAACAQQMEGKNGEGLAAFLITM